MILDQSVLVDKDYFLFNYKFQLKPAIIFLPRVLIIGEFNKILFKRLVTFKKTTALGLLSWYELLHPKE